MTDSPSALTLRGFSLEAHRAYWAEAASSSEEQLTQLVHLASLSESTNYEDKRNQLLTCFLGAAVGGLPH
jgi:hypothetical protein